MTQVHIRLYSIENFYKNIQLNSQTAIKFPLQQEHKICLPSGQIIYANGLLALPVIIHGHLFQFLVLVATFAEHIELVIGIESLIQLEASLFLADLTLSVTPRSIPIYPTSEVTLVPKEQTLIYL